MCYFGLSPRLTCTAKALSGYCDGCMLQLSLCALVTVYLSASHAKASSSSSIHRIHTNANTHTDKQSYQHTHTSKKRDDGATKSAPKNWDLWFDVAFFLLFFITLNFTQFYLTSFELILCFIGIFEEKSLQWFIFVVSFTCNFEFHTFFHRAVYSNILSQSGHSAHTWISPFLIYFDCM